MRKFIARMFNLILQEEYTLLETQYNSIREYSLVLNNQIADMTRAYNSEREERQRLQDIIFRNYGVVQMPDQGTAPQTQEPIKTGRERWSNLKSRMEADDRKRAESARTN